MSVTASETIFASKEKVWSAVTDIENASKRISAIKKIEILEKPTSGLIGLKWKETRIMFGKEATETMWITQAKENQFYETTAISSGCIYNSKVQIDELSKGVKISMSFTATPQTFAAKLFAPLSFLFVSMIKKAFQNDLSDLKRVLEKVD